MNIHPSESRALANHGWLRSRHTFSFADYYEPERMGFGALRVINDDSVAKGMGFGTHPHRDMEIISIPLEGALRHQDSVGNSTVIKKGEVQIMSAGTGISHSEYNDSQVEEVKFLQIWVLPKKLGVKPRYEQKLFSHDERANKLSLVVSPDGRQGSLTVNQDAFFSLVDLEQGRNITYERYMKTNGLYLFLISGEIAIDGQTIGPRDGVEFKNLDSLDFKALSASEVLLMEVPLI